MCDENSSMLQNSLRSLPRREPKVIFQRAEYIFPALEDSLVSVFVFLVHRTESYKCVFLEDYIFEHFATKYFSSFVHLNCLKFLLSYHIVFGTFCHIRNLIHYILLCKLFYKCVNLQCLNVKFKFCKPWMKHKLVCEVCGRNMLQTCRFKDNSISVSFGNVT
jgi:hypothetical protein